MSPELRDFLRIGTTHPGEPSPRPAPERSAPTTQSGLVSVVVPCCGQLEYTRICVPSLLRHSRRPFELIFLDVCSMDGTPEYLAGVAAAAPVCVELVHCSAEAGFQTAFREALARSRGDFVVWLNNDTIVTDGWLQQMVALASVNAAVGMVGPMSNYAPAQQRVMPVPYRIRPNRSGPQPAPEPGVNVDGLEHFASAFREAHKGQWSEVDRLGGFCLLIKRPVLDVVHLFDEDSAPGVFDADALSARVRQAGYHCVCCRDLFVHHFGTRLVSV